MIYGLIGFLCVVILVLCVKLHYLHKTTDEIVEAFADRLETDTNTLIDISTNDKYMRRLAGEINVQLRRLREERIRFQQGDTELKSAVTNISHDLRTPLTAICGYLELLEEAEKSEEVGRYIEVIGERVESMKTLTEELFRYSMVTSSRELQPRQVELKGLLEDALLSFYGVFSQKGITPEISLPETPIMRKLDPAAVSRIFSNIINNAVKYSEGDFQVSLAEDGTVAFTNTAKGLNAVMVGRLFDRFYTVEASRNSTGLGLSIAKHLTEAMGGKIEAHYFEEKLNITLKFPMIL